MLQWLEYEPVGLTMHGVSMGYCLRLAYGLTVQKPYELVGPAWIDPPTDSEYEITARAAQPVTEQQIKLMLRTLLKERFKLAVHREPRDLPAYTLLPSDRPPALRPSVSGNEPKMKSQDGPYNLVFQHFSMAQLALQLGPPMTSRPVADRTGLQGFFDFTLDLGRYLTDPGTGQMSVGSTGKLDMEEAVFRGVRDPGLTLKPGRMPVEVLVVDHVEKTPAQN